MKPEFNIDKEACWEYSASSNAASTLNRKQVSQAGRAAVAAALGTVDCKTRADAQAVGEALISQGEKLTGQTNNKKEAMVNAAMLSVAFLKGKSV